MFLLLFYVSVALLFSFLCSVAEAVLLSVTRPYTASLEKEGSEAGRVLRGLKEDVNRPLAAILTLNTIAHTVGAAGAGAQASEVFGSQYLGLASAVLTLLILVLSEIIPKTLGAVHWRELAPPTAFFLRRLVWTLYPFVLLSESLTRRLSKGRIVKGFVREEFAAMVDVGTREGQLGLRESRVLKNLFRFRSSTVKDIMTPRPVVFALPEALSVGELVRDYPESPFSRIPLYGANREDITGFVLRSDLLLAQARGDSAAPLSRFKRDLRAIPVNHSLFDLLDFFLKHRQHIVMVVDEYGGMEGLVTLEDVVETLLGFEIVDELDETVDMQALARDLWERRAREMGIRLPGPPRGEKKG